MTRYDDTKDEPTGSPDQQGGEGHVHSPLRNRHSMQLALDAAADSGPVPSQHRISGKELDSFLKKSENWNQERVRKQELARLAMDSEAGYLAIKSAKVVDNKAEVAKVQIAAGKGHNGTRPAAVKLDL
jgi:hypothetical protein